MAQGVAGTCLVCDLPDEKRWEVDARIIRGDTHESVGTLAGANLLTVKRHLDNGHVRIDPHKLRGWMQKNVHSIKSIERARTAEIEKAPTLTPADISARLLALERYAMRVLASLEADSDYRGSIQAVEALRRLTSDLATVNGAGKPAQDPSDFESVDTKQLREGILEMFRKGQGSPETLPWQPLR
jgi:hypothetical protein